MSSIRTLEAANQLSRLIASELAPELHRFANSCIAAGRFNQGEEWHRHAYELEQLADHSTKPETPNTKAVSRLVEDALSLLNYIERNPEIGVLLRSDLVEVHEGSYVRLEPVPREENCFATAARVTEKP